nr:FACT complex subunit SSRP1 [Ipomoea batatas]
MFNNISLGGHGGTNLGQVKVHAGGILWKKLGGGKAVEVDKSDIAGLTSFFHNSYGITPEEKQLYVNGKNWGEVDLTGNMLTFLVGSKQVFEISLADVSQTHLQAKNDVMLEFHVDDTTGANEKDSLLMEIRPTRYVRPSKAIDLLMKETKAEIEALNATTAMNQ